MTEILAGYRMASQARQKVGKGAKSGPGPGITPRSPTKLTSPALNKALCWVRSVVAGIPASCGRGGEAGG